MQVWIAFAAGAFIGSAVTVLLIGLCQAAGNADRLSERFEAAYCKDQEKDIGKTAFPGKMSGMKLSRM
jgi:hypothetical protein